MKKLIPILFAVLLFASCQKDPSTSKLSEEFLVYTNYDKGTNFGTFHTYYLPDSVLLITNSENRQYMSSANGDKILQTFEDRMEAAGYVKVDSKEEADLGLQISYIESVNYFTNYTGSPYWWWGYPNYWWPGYWGPGWNDWYYPYPIVYSYSIGSLLAEMVDLKQDAEVKNKKLPVVWNAYMSGLLSGSAQFDLQLTIRAIDQAYAQSPYIKSNAN